MINKDIRKSLARKKGYEIIIWIWNDSNIVYFGALKNEEMSLK